MATDLLARVCAELEQRMAALRPLLGEYERLLAAADALVTTEADAALGDGSPTARVSPPPESPRAVAVESPPAVAVEAPRAGAVKVPRAGVIEVPRAGVIEVPRAGAVGVPEPSQAAVAVHAPPSFELAEEPEPERKRPAPSDVRQAILAALEHGSHTVSELVMVTAMSPSEIRANLSRLVRQRQVARVKRRGDGKSAYALPVASAHT
jgi:hypothetical protein